MEQLLLGHLFLQASSPYYVSSQKAVEQILSGNGRQRGLC